MRNVIFEHRKILSQIPVIWNLEPCTEGKFDRRRKTIQVPLNDITPYISLRYHLFLQCIGTPARCSCIFHCDKVIHSFSRVDSSRCSVHESKRRTFHLRYREMIDFKVWCILYGGKKKFRTRVLGQRLSPFYLRVIPDSIWRKVLFGNLFKGNE